VIFSETPLEFSNKFSKNKIFYLGILPLLKIPAFEANISIITMDVFDPTVHFKEKE